MVVDLIRSRAALEAEIWTLRQQINVLRRTAPKKLSFSAIDRLIFVGLYRLFPNVRDGLAIVKPETIVRWHRVGFRSHWRWKSRPRGGRPTVPLELRRLIREMSIANPLWGAPRVHGELHKLGINIGQTSLAKYIVRQRHPPSQGWKTFIRNHADGIAAMDLFVVPTISFRLLFIDHGAWPAADSMVWRHIASNRGMDRKSEHGSMRLGTSSPPSDPRPGSGLWRGLHPKNAINRHSRSTDVAALPMAKRIC
jgi:hypothetical protein